MIAIFDLLLLSLSDKKTNRPFWTFHSKNGTSLKCKRTLSRKAREQLSKAKRHNKDKITILQKDYETFIG